MVAISPGSRSYIDLFISFGERFGDGVSEFNILVVSRSVCPDATGSWNVYWYRSSDYPGWNARSVLDFIEML